MPQFITGTVPISVDRIRQYALVVARQVPPFRLTPEPLDDEAAALLDHPQYVDPVVGTRHRIGGSPDVSPDEWPTCSAGDGPMTFYGQFDGFPATSEFELADAGLILVFVCFDCFDVRAVLISS